ncbi:MAG TPA: penicillin-binding transpeptidase domain-containing protein, partial [Ferruginibacter sp.]|nr:penicillin-binding transpeptidase domain-containing protein [Ferruginibacter sp.]
MKKLLNCLSFMICLLWLVSCSVNKADNDEDLKKYFDEQKVDGCFTMLNNADGNVTVYNMKYDTMRFNPASTFKIFSSLVGLQTGVIVNDTMVIKWDAVTRFLPNGDTATKWNKDLGMTEAFKVNSDPYYQEVARRIGKDTMQQWIDSVGYGNKNISGPVDS